MLTCALVTASVLFAAAAPDPAGRVLRTEADVPAPVSRVWDAFTTKEGIESWMVPLCEIDLKYGGVLRTTYNKEEGLGGPGTITHSIVSYEPERMLAWKTTPPANATPGIRAVCEHGWTVLRFEPTSASTTRVSVSMMGIGEGEVFDQGYAHFERGNAWTMDQLRKHFEKGAAESNDRVWERVSGLVGGTWVGEIPAVEGRPGVRVLNTFARGAGGALVGQGWFVTGNSPLLHSSSQIYRLGKQGPVLFHEVNHQGATSSGSLTLEGDTVVWDWNLRGPDGRREGYDIRMNFAGSDEYGMTMADRKGAVLLNQSFKRGPETVPSAGGAADPHWSVLPATFAWAGLGLGVNKSVVVGAPASDVFGVLSTSEGWKTFLGVADAKIELRPGGPFEISFGAEAPAGSRGSEGCQVLSFVPGKMISYTWNAPPMFAVERHQHTWVVITLANEGGKTRVTLDQLGFGQGGSWPQIQAYFDRAWGNVLTALEKHFAGASAR